jgi:hypothetical protein
MHIGIHSFVWSDGRSHNQIEDAATVQRGAALLREQARVARAVGAQDHWTFRKPKPWP